MLKKAFKFIADKTGFRTSGFSFGLAYFMFGFVLMLAGIAASSYGFLYGSASGQNEQINQPQTENAISKNKYEYSDSYLYKPIKSAVFNNKKNSLSIYNAMTKSHFTTMHCGKGNIDITLILNPSKDGSQNMWISIIRNRNWEKYISYNIILVMQKHETINENTKRDFQICNDLPSLNSMISNWIEWKRVERVASISKATPVEILNNRFIAKSGQ